MIGMGKLATGKKVPICQSFNLINYHLVAKEVVTASQLWNTLSYMEIFSNIESCLPPQDMSQSFKTLPDSVGC